MLKTIKILLIENDNHLRRNLVDIIEIHHYKMYAAQDGFDGYSQALLVKPDLIICDLMMPKMTGFEFINIIKDSPLSHVPLILLSGKKYFDEEEKKNISRVSAHLTKPFSIADLMSLIKKYTENT